jgi:hypothetical protein
MFFSKHISTVNSQIADFGSNNKGFLGLERMKSYAPIEAIDPLLCVFADRELNESTMTVLLSHYDVLKRYSQTIFSESSNNLAFDAPELPDHNTFILFVRERYARASKLTEEYRGLGENCRPNNMQVILHILRWDCNNVRLF